MPLLIGIECAVERHRHSQDDVLAETLRWLDRIESGVDEKAVSRLFGRSGVRCRYSLKPLAEVFSDATFSERNAQYREAMIESSAAVVSRAVATVGLANVDAIISTSCTGFMIPAVDAYVADRLRLGPWLTRLPITEAGCAGGAVALARTGDLLRAHPERSALVLASEYSSLTFQARNPSTTNLVATAIFGDGAAAASLVGKRHPLAHHARAEMLASGSYFLAGNLGAMGYDVVDSGLRLVLDKRLPDLLHRNLDQAVREFLGRAGTTFDEIEGFAIHPGGRRVLDVTQEELGLTDDALLSSREILRDYGNMSSATILFVLDRALARVDSGRLVLGIGFGPGFGIEFSLWRTMGSRASSETKQDGAEIGKS